MCGSASITCTYSLLGCQCRIDKPVGASGASGARSPATRNAALRRTGALGSASAPRSTGQPLAAPNSSSAGAECFSAPESAYSALARRVRRGRLQEAQQLRERAAREQLCRVSCAVAHDGRAHIGLCALVVLYSSAEHPERARLHGRQGVVGQRKQRRPHVQRRQVCPACDQPGVPAYVCKAHRSRCRSTRRASRGRRARRRRRVRLGRVQCGLHVLLRARQPQGARMRHHGRT